MNLYEEQQARLKALRLAQARAKEEELAKAKTTQMIPSKPQPRIRLKDMIPLPSNLWEPTLPHPKISVPPQPQPRRKDPFLQSQNQPTIRLLSSSNNTPIKMPKTNPSYPTSKPTPAEMRREDYSFKGYIEPILQAVKKDPNALRPSEMLYKQAENMRKIPDPLHQFTKVPSGLTVAGGVLEGFESTLELAFPYPKPRTYAPSYPSINYPIIDVPSEISKAMGKGLPSYVLHPGKLTNEPPAQISVPTAPRLAGLISSAYIQGKVVEYVFDLGPKVERLKGANEIEQTKVKGGTIESQRLTKLVTEQESVSNEQAAYLRSMERYYIPEEVRFGGTEKAIQKGGEEFDLYMKASEATRNAEPVIRAAKGQSSLIEEFMETDVLELSRRTQTNALLPKEIMQTAKVTSESEFIGPEIILTKRTFTGAQISGKIDPQVFIGLTKNVPKEVAQNWYYQMGGLSTELIEKNVQEMTSIKLYTDIINLSLRKIPSSLVTGAALTSMLVPKVSAKNVQKLVTPTAPKVNFGNITNVVTNQKSKQTPFQVPFQALGQTPKQIPFQVPKTPTITQTFMRSPPNMKVPKFPGLYFPRGGGEASTRSFDRLTGKWFPRKHPVKSWDKMLGTFGFKVKSTKLKRIGKMEVPKFSLGKMKAPHIHRIVTGRKQRRRKKR